MRVAVLDANDNIVESGIIGYNNAMTNYNTPGRIESFCNEIAFINQGDSTLIINTAVRVPPGGSFGLDGKQFEKDFTYYNIAFEGGTFNDCCVIRKYYNKF